MARTAEPIVRRFKLWLAIATALVVAIIVTGIVNLPARAQTAAGAPTASQTGKANRPFAAGRAPVQRRRVDIVPGGAFASR